MFKLPSAFKYLTPSKQVPMSREGFAGFAEEAYAQARHAQRTPDVAAQAKLRSDGDREHVGKKARVSRSSSRDNKRGVQRVMDYLTAHRAEYDPDKVDAALTALKGLRAKKRFSPGDLAQALMFVSPPHERAAVKAGAKTIATEVHAWLQPGSPEQSALMDSSASSVALAGKARQTAATETASAKNAADVFRRYFESPEKGSPEADAVGRLTRELNRSGLTEGLSPENVYASLVEVPQLKLEFMVDRLADLVEQANGQEPSPALLQQMQVLCQNITEAVAEWMARLTRVSQLLANELPTHLPVPEQTAWINLAKGLVRVAEAHTAPHGLAHSALRLALRKEQQVSSAQWARARAAAQAHVRAVQEAAQVKAGVGLETEAQLERLKKEQQEQEAILLKAVEGDLQKMEMPPHPSARPPLPVEWLNDVPGDPKPTESASVSLYPKELASAVLRQPILPTRPKRSSSSTPGDGTLRAKRWAADQFNEAERMSTLRQDGATSAAVSDDPVLRDLQDIERRRRESLQSEASIARLIDGGGNLDAWLAAHEAAQSAPSFLPLTTEADIDALLNEPELQAVPKDLTAVKPAPLVQPAQRSSGAEPSVSLGGGADH